MDLDRDHSRRGVVDTGNPGGHRGCHVFSALRSLHVILVGVRRQSNRLMWIRHTMSRGSQSQMERSQADVPGRLEHAGVEGEERLAGVRGHTRALDQPSFRAALLTLGIGLLWAALARWRGRHPAQPW
jgi:hypothetical protein